MKKKNKGFTLIELLAVIIVLSVISLIATPSVLSTIERSKKATFIRSAEGLLESSKLYYMNSQLFSAPNLITFNCDSETKKCVSDILDKNGKKLAIDMSGSVGDGEVTIDDSGDISFKITNNKFCAYKYASSDKINVIDGNCDNLEIVHDTEAPEITKNSVTTTSNSVIIGYTIYDTSEIKSVSCTYGTTKGTYDQTDNVSVSKTACRIGKLEAETKYYFKVCATDDGFNEGCMEGNITIDAVSQPEIIFEQVPTTPSNGYLQSQTAKVTYTTSSGQRYFVRTTKAGTSNENVITCSETIGTDPGEPNLESCNGASTKNLNANTWYETNGNVDITYNEANDSTGEAIYAALYDGVNLGNAASAGLLKIDSAKPELSLITVTSTTSSIIIQFTATDEHSKVDITKFDCRIGDNLGNVVSLTSDTYRCTLSGVTSETDQTYSITATDKVGNVSLPLTGNAKIANMPQATITWSGYTVGTIENGTINYVSASSTAEYVSYDVATITFNSDNIEGTPSNYVKTEVSTTATLNGGTLKVCGNDVASPSTTCTSATTTLEAGYWYKVEGTTTVDIKFTEEGDLNAYTYDSSNREGRTSGRSRHIIPAVSQIEYDNTQGYSKNNCDNLKCALDELYATLSE